MKKNRYLMYAIALLQGMVFYGPVATLYRQAHGVSVLQITLIESISLALCLLLEIPWGAVADKIGYKRTMGLCCGLYFVSKIVFWQADGFWWFLLERVMLSVVIAGLSGVDTSVLYLSCAKGESQKAFGIYNSLQMTGLIAASAVFSLWIGDGYRLAGALTTVSYGLAALAALGLTEVKPEAGRPYRMQDFLGVFRQTLSNGRLLALLIAAALLSETHQTITVFLNQIQYERCGMSSTSIGFVYIVVALAGLCGAGSAWVTEKIGVKRSGVLLFGVSAAACVALAVTQNAAFSIAAVLMLRMANSLFQPLQEELQNQAIHTVNRATALSVNAMVIDCVGVGTSVVFGALAQVRLQSAFLLGAGLCLGGMSLFLLWCAGGGALRARL